MEENFFNAIFFYTLYKSFQPQLLKHIFITGKVGTFPTTGISEFITTLVLKTPFYITMIVRLAIATTIGSDQAAY